MKARVKATGEVVEVEKHMLHFADNSTEIYYRDIYSSNGRFKEEELTEMVDDVVIISPDWQAYRMEVAKECMANMVEGCDPDELAYFAELAVKATDALIARLKEQKGEQKDTDDGYEYKQIAICEDDLYKRIEVLESKGWTHITDQWNEEHGCFLVNFKRLKEQKGE